MKIALTDLDLSVFGIVKHLSKYFPLFIMTIPPRLPCFITTVFLFLGNSLFLYTYMAR